MSGCMSESSLNSFMSSKYAFGLKNEQSVQNGCQTMENARSNNIDLANRFNGNIVIVKDNQPIVKLDVDMKEELK